MGVYQVLCGCFCVSMCVCPLHTDPICLVAGHSLGKCIQAKNSHTAQRTNYEHPLGEGRRGEGLNKWIIGACPS